MKTFEENKQIFRIFPVFKISLTKMSQLLTLSSLTSKLSMGYSKLTDEFCVAALSMAAMSGFPLQSEDHKKNSLEMCHHSVCIVHTYVHVCGHIHTCIVHTHTYIPSCIRDHWMEKWTIV